VNKNIPKQTCSVMIAETAAYILEVIDSNKLSKIKLFDAKNTAIGINIIRIQ
jgi:hypothetical protein